MHPSESIPAVYQIIYASSASVSMDPSTLETLLRGSRARNKLRGITGILLCHDQTFLQVLEGEQSTVEDVFEKISRDPRHSALTVLWRGAVPEREFPEHFMAFRDSLHPFLAEMAGRNESFILRLPQEIVGNPSPAGHFIRAFRKVTQIDA